MTAYLLDPAQPALLSKALALADSGLPVFPVDRQKCPLVTNGLHAATTDRQVIAAWWTRWPAANVAVRTGKASGLVVLDVDGQDGADSLHELERDTGRSRRRRAPSRRAAARTTSSSGRASRSGTARAGSGPGSTSAETAATSS